MRGISGSRFLWPRNAFKLRLSLHSSQRTPSAARIQKHCASQQSCRRVGTAVAPVDEQGRLQVEAYKTLFDLVRLFSRPHCSKRACRAYVLHVGSSLVTDLQQAAPKSAYVHLPFCKRRCYYCDFPIQTVGRDAAAPTVQSKMQGYVETVCREIKATRALGADQLQTVFFGGGTPSLVQPRLLHQIIDTLRSSFGLAAGAEISMEADPGTFTEASLREYMALGISRFSIGIQAFEEEILERCGRSHGLAEVHRAIQDVHAAGVPNWSLDLISGLPHTSIASWQTSLREALAARPTHISIYDLQVEEGTKFGRLYAPGQFPLPTDETAARMFCAASETLRAAGMEHYEISSYAAAGHRCQHNSTYWSGAPFYAFGLGSASYLGLRRFSRPKGMAAYTRWVDELEHSGHGIPGAEDAIESAEERLLDFVMLRLRLSDGLDFRILRKEFGEAAASIVAASLQQHVPKGLVEALDNGQRLRLSDPGGFLVSNDIISDVFAALDRADLRLASHA